MAKLYIVRWKRHIFKASTFEDALNYAKRMTAFEYDGPGNRAVIESQGCSETEGTVYVIWLDNNLGLMQWVISGTFLIEEEK